MLASPWVRVDVLITPDSPQGLAIRRIRTTPGAMGSWELQERAAEALRQEQARLRREEEQRREEEEGAAERRLDGGSRGRG